MAQSILIVDDSASMRQLISFSLNSAGYAVTAAVHGRDALEKIDGSKFGMVITDLNMPEMDGRELIKQLRSKPGYKFIPVVMLTTESQESKKLEGRSAGATGWIVKPFTPDQLLGVVSRLVK